MKFDEEKVLKGIEHAKQCIISHQQKISFGGHEYLTWPLFFLECSTQNSDVDVCTSGLGVMALSNFDITENEPLKCTISDSINTLISIRNDDGSWPSKISLVSRDVFSMEGVISDTYYALSALLSVKFLSENPLVNDIRNLKTNVKLDSLDERIEFVNESVNWLLDNRVEHNQGWQYTGVNYLENPSDKEILPAYTLPTAYAIIVMSDILKIVSEIRPNHELVRKIQMAIGNSIKWFRDIQSNNHSDCGFGIKRGERSRIGNTGRVIKALCNALTRENEDMIEPVLNKAVGWLIRNYKPSNLLFIDVCEDFQQLIIEKESGQFKTAYRRSNNHESFAEPIIIDSFMAYLESIIGKKSKFISKHRIFQKIALAVSNLLLFQVNGGDQDGAVKCRRIAPSEQLTMYSTSDFINSLFKLHKDTFLFKKVKHSTPRSIVIVVLSLSFVIASFLIPILTNNYSYWYTVPIGIVIAIFINIISNKLL